MKTKKKQIKNSTRLHYILLDAIVFNKLVFRIMHMYNNFPSERCYIF